jgi:hypothetical protein
VRPRDQLIGALILCVATGFGLLRIAESKNETAVGAGVFRLDERRRDEIAHYDGHVEEAAAFAREIAWYQELQAAPFLQAHPAVERRAWDWALESALRSARRAAASAGAA